METILIRACKNGNVDLARCLLERGADVNFTIDHISTFEAVFDTRKQNNKEEEILELFLEFGYDPNTIHKKKYTNKTALEIFCLNKKLCLADIIINAGADVNLVYDYRHTVLWTVCNNRKFDVIGFLLNHGAKVYMDDSSNYNFYKTEKRHEYESQKFIFEHILEYEKDHVREALSSMVYDNYDFLKKVLQKHPEFINLTDEDGKTILMELCDTDYFTSYDNNSTLDEHRIICTRYDKDRQNDSECYCDYENYMSLIQFMLDSGADVHQTDDDGISAYGYINSENYKLRKYLLEYIIGEKVEGTCINLYTIFETFAKHGKLQQVKDVLATNRLFQESVKDVFETDEVTLEIKDFLLKWSKSQDELYGKSKYSLSS